jgi:hypothetical protein
MLPSWEEIIIDLYANSTTMPSLERFGKSVIFVEGADCHSELESPQNAPTMHPSWEEFVSDFEEVALKHNLAE